MPDEGAEGRGPAGESPVSEDAGPSLRTQLLGGLGILLFLALFSLTVAVVIWVRLELPPRSLIMGLAAVIVVDVVVLVLFADYRLRHLVLRPVERMVEGAERIAIGADTRLESSGTVELRRLARATNEMARRLIENQRLLADNVHSLDATNRELTQARDELVHAEKLASIGRLAAGIAHEIGNPLGAILGYVELARRGAREQDWTDEIEHETRRIDRIVRGLLEYARPKAAAPRPMDVNFLVREAVGLLRTQGRFREIEVVLSLVEGLPWVRADPGQFEQVLVNLLLNAADAVGEKGTPGVIEISSQEAVFRSEEPPPGFHRAGDPRGINYSHLRRLGRPPAEHPIPDMTEGERLVEIRVRDNGVGIEAKHLSRLFDPFFTTKPPGSGTGLGLAVAARLIDGMGGIIRASSGEGQGATFTISLPAARTLEEG